MSHLGEQIIEWKLNLQTFFREDWSRIRPLIMQLEERSWSDKIAADSFESGDAALFGHQRPKGGDMNGPVVVRSSVSGDRLSDLADQIKQRLRASQGGGN